MLDGVLVAEVEVEVLEMDEVLEIEVIMELLEDIVEDTEVGEPGRH